MTRCLHASGLLQRPRRSRSIAVACAVLTLLSASPAGSAPVPAELRASLLLRTLAYDHNLSSRVAGNQLTVLVIEGTQPQQTQAVANVLRSMAADVSVAGLPVRVVTESYGDGLGIEDRIRAANPDVIYLGVGLEEAAASLVELTNELQATLVAADGADMPNGCALGFTVEGDRPVIVLDVARAEAAGMDFDVTVLRVARLL